MAVNKWRPYLQRGPFVIRTNNKSLCTLGDQQLDTDLQQKAMSKLVDLDFTFQCTNRAASNSWSTATTQNTNSWWWTRYYSSYNHPCKLPMVSRTCPKLSFKFFVLFQVIERIGATTYKLDLLTDSKMNLVFHMSQLPTKAFQVPITIYCKSSFPSDL